MKVKDIFLYKQLSINALDYFVFSIIRSVIKQIGCLTFGGRGGIANALRRKRRMRYRPTLAVYTSQASCFLPALSRNEATLLLAFLALMTCMIFLKSRSSCSVQGSDIAEKSMSFGSLISPIFLAFKILCYQFYCCTWFNKHS